MSIMPTCSNFNFGLFSFLFFIRSLLFSSPVLSCSILLAGPLCHPWDRVKVLCVFVGTRRHIQPISRRATFLHCALSHCVAWLVAVQNTINSWTTNIDYWDNSVLCPIIANYLFDVCQHMPYLTLSGCKISKIMHTQLFAMYFEPTPLVAAC